MGNSRVLCGVIFPLFIFAQVSAFAQGTREDYLRADSLRVQAQKLVYHTDLHVQWQKQRNSFWYRTNSRDGKFFYLVDAETADRAPAFDHARLAESLSKATGETYAAGNLPFSTISLTRQQQLLEVQIDDFAWTCDLATYEWKKGERVERRGRRSAARERSGDQNAAVLSPDSSYEAFVKNYNVFLRDKTTGEEFQLSHDGTEGGYYSSSIVWSPDSKKFISNCIIPGYERRIHYIESSPQDQLQPKYSNRVYPKPGDVLTQRKPHLFQIETRRHIEIDDALFSNPYHIRSMRWRENGSAFTFNYNQRGHQVYRVIEVNAENGTARALVDERNDTFFCYYSKLYRYDVNDGEEIIWMSERDGWNHLYLYNGTTGTVKNQITEGEWVVRGVERVDEENRQIIFRASGRERGQDPYFIHYYRINFDGSGLIRLTEGDGTHEANFSDDGAYFVDTYSRVDFPPKSVLRAAGTGKAILELEKADIRDLFETGLTLPEVFCAKGRDGRTDIWGIICRPSNFDGAKKYKVIEYIYAGPHNSFVPKSFRPYFRNLQALAELGFIVVQIDGMGTSNRSKDFHDVCWQNLKDAGFPDRILWHKQVAKKYSNYDISDGVGIYGHSAGGQNSTGALLFYPEFYTVAVSSCGCHDNRMDKISWNEQWMGYPLGPHYAASSNVDNAHKLRGKLFLIVGEMDTNVDPASTMQVVDALIKAHKDFDLLVLPGVGHSIGGDYGERRRRDYFVKHLMGVEPPDWNAHTHQ